MQSRIDNFRQIIKDCFPEEAKGEDIVEYIKKLPSLVNKPTEYIQPWEISDIILCIYECYDIEGFSISDLPLDDEVLSGSLLFASTAPNQPSVNAAYYQLSSQMLSNIADQLKENGYLKPMAYQSRNNFSLAEHDHDKLYTADFDMQPSEWINSIAQENEMLVLGRISATTYDEHDGTLVEHTEEYELSCPKIEFPPPKLNEPAIGELKFIPTSMLAKLAEEKIMYYGSKANIDIYADDFDGWVFPNGTTFTHEANDFPRANEIYGKSSTTFTVPLLDQFIYAVPKTDDDKLMQTIQQHVVVGQHSHVITSSGIYGKTSIQNPKITALRVTTSEYGSLPIPPDKEGLAVAYFGNSSDIQTIETSSQSQHISLDGTEKSVVSIQTAPNDSQAGTYQPECQLMPVLIYIGAKRYEVKEA